MATHRQGTVLADAARERGSDAVAGVGAQDERVKQALTRLDELDGLPLVEHVAAYDEVHQLLQDELTMLDDR